MAQVRVKIGSVSFGLPQEIVSVGWDAVLSMKPDDDSRLFLEELKSDMTLSCKNLPSMWEGDTQAEKFAHLLEAEADCHTFEVSIEVLCDDEWTEKWSGTFDSKWKSDLDKKTITFRPKQVNAAACLKKEWTEPVNIYDVAPVVRTRPYNVTYKWDTIGPVTCTDDPPDNPGFCWDGIKIVVASGPHAGECSWHYHRFERPGTCDGATPVPPDEFQDWELLSGGCPGTPVYWACPESARVVANFRNGRTLKDVLEFLLEETGCGLSLVSDFFNCNGDDTAPDNEAYTAAATYLQHLVIHQKSDVKRHDATETSKAAAWVMKLQDLLSDLKIMFKVDWRIENDDTFRLEHVSYFEAQPGADYTSKKYERSLSAEKGDVPLRTRYSFRDEQCSDYFKGRPIEIFCGEGEKQIRLSLFSTDLGFITSSDNAESIGDDGFVLIATTPSGFTNIYENIDDNRPLSWSELHTNYHLHEMFSAGTINGEEVTPLSLKKYRKQPPFRVVLCCDETFDPSLYITTSLGEGEVVEAERNLAEEILTVTLRY